MKKSGSRVYLTVDEMYPDLLTIRRLKVRIGDVARKHEDLASFVYIGMNLHKICGWSDVLGRRSDRML